MRGTGWAEGEVGLQCSFTRDLGRANVGLWTWVAFQNSIEMRLEALYPPLYQTVIGWEPLSGRLQTNTLAFVVLVF